MAQADSCSLATLAVYSDLETDSLQLFISDRLIAENSSPYRKHQTIIFLNHDQNRMREASAFLVVKWHDHDTMPIVSFRGLVQRCCAAFSSKKSRNEQNS
jgi:hypothetical protein